MQPRRESKLLLDRASVRWTSRRRRPSVVLYTKTSFRILLFEVLLPCPPFQLQRSSIKAYLRLSLSGMVMIRSQAGSSVGLWNCATYGCRRASCRDFERLLCCCLEITTYWPQHLHEENNASPLTRIIQLSHQQTKQSVNGPPARKEIVLPVLLRACV